MTSDNKKNDQTITANTTTTTANRGKRRILAAAFAAVFALVAVTMASPTHANPVYGSASIWSVTEYIASFFGKDNYATADAASSSAALVMPPPAISTDFESFTPGAHNGQFGWLCSGCIPNSPGYDHAIAATTSFPGVPATFGAQSFRISNAVTSGSFGDFTFSGPVANEAGESTADNGTLSGGIRQTHFAFSFDIYSTVPGAEQPGLQFSVSPDRGDGARMSFLRFRDTPTGLAIDFADYQGVGASTSVLTTIATGVNRAVAHNIRMEMEFVNGSDNDIVRVYLDGSLIHTGTSWEEFFRDYQGGLSRTVDSLLFQNRDTAGTAPATVGNGFLVDNISLDPVTPPEVVSINRNGSTPTNATSVSWNVTFSEPVSGVDAGDFVLAASGVTAGITSVIPAGPASVYTVTASVSGTGTVGLDLIDNDTIIDADTNPLSGTGTGNGNFTGQVYAVDTVAPTVVSSVRVEPDPTNSMDLDFTVTFSEAVTGVDTSDFSITTTGVINGAFVSSVTPAAGPAGVYNVKVMLSSGSNGTVRLDVIDNGSINDTVGNNLGGPGAGNGGFNTGQFYTIDTTPPASITIDEASGQTDPTSISPVNFEVVASDPIIGFDSSDIQIGGTAFGTGSFPQALVTGSGTTYNVAVTGMNQSGTVTITFPAGAATDMASNATPAPTLIDNSVTFNLVDTPAVVSPSAPAGWLYLSENTAGGTGHFVAGPSGAGSVGDGSARMVLTATNQGFTLVRPGYTGQRFDQFTEISYSTHQNAGGNAAVFQMNIDFDLNDGFAGWQGRLLFEPSSQGTPVVQNGVWQNWDVLNGKLFTSANTVVINNLSVPSPCPYSGGIPCTRASLLAAAPNAGIHNSPLAAILWKAGSGWTFDGNLDNLVVGVNSANTTYDFEPDPPTISIGDNLTIAEGDAGTSVATFQVTLSQATADGFTASAVINTADGSATAGTDYVAITNQTITFPDINDSDPNLDLDNNPLTQNVSVTINGDTITEGNEGFTVNLSSVLNALAADASGDGTIVDDDPTPSASIDSVSANEGDNLVFTVTLSNPSAQNITVNYTVADVTTSAGDYGTATPNPLVINAGSTTGTITIPTTEDTTEEPNETLSVTITGVTNGSIGSPASGTGTINNDDNSDVTIDATASATEGGVINFTVTMSSPNSQNVNVAYTVAHVSTSAGDYSVTSPNPLVIPAGSTTGTISLATVDDNIDELNETFTVTLTSVSNLMIGTGSVGTGTIIDNDTSLVSINATSSANEGSPVVFTVTLSNPNSQTVTVDYTLADVTTSPADYGTATPDPVVITAGNTTANITVATINDLDESDETFTITLDSATNATVDTANDVGTGTITDVDTSPVYVNDNFINPVPGQDPDAGGPATNFGFDSFPTVQGGVNGVSAGGQVIVYDGIYVEQVNISKNLTMDGESVAGTIIKMPPTAGATVSDIGDVVIVDIKDGADVAMQDLTVQGTFDYAGCVEPNPYFDGIFVYDGASLALSNAAVLDIRQTNPSLFGCQNGFGLSVGYGSSEGDATVTNVTFDGYQKEAMFVDGPNSSVNVQTSTFNGEGPSNTAQNIFQISSGATATINGSAIGAAGQGSQCNIPTNCGPDAATQFQGSGVLLFDAGAVQLTNNTFTDNDNAISAYGGNGALTVTNNTFNGNRYYGMLLSEGTTTATGNTMAGPMNVGLSLYTDSDDSANAVASFDQNTMTGAATALQIIDSDLGNLVSKQPAIDGDRMGAIRQIIRGADTKGETTNSGTITVPVLDANYNRIISTTTAIDNPQNNTANLEFNWWGCNAGPGNAGCGAVNEPLPLGQADFTPWVVLTASATPLSILPNGTVTVSADLSKDNLGGTLTTAIPDTPVAYTATEGNMSPTSDVITNNTVDQSTFTSTSSNDATATVTVDNQPITFNIDVDGDAPTVVSIVRNDPNPTNASSVAYTVTFNENVTGVDAADFAVTITSGTLAGVSVSSVSGSGATYIVTVNTGTGSGNLRLDIPAGATIEDSLGNDFVPPYTGGEVYTIDRELVAVTINQAFGQSDPTGAMPINFTATFAEDVTGFDGSDISFAGSTATGPLAAVVTPGSGPEDVYNVAVSGMTSAGYVVVSINAGAAQDNLGNNSLASTSTDNSVLYTAGSSPLYVDDDGTTSGDGTSCTGSVPAYTTIQSAVNAALTGNIIRVCDGTYAENVIVDRSVSIHGFNNETINPNTGTRGAETIVVPAATETSLQASTSGTVFRVGTGSGPISVAIKGLTISGHNPLLTNGRTLNGVEVHTGAGIISSTGSFDNETSGFNVTLDVENNIVQNFERYGVYISGVASGSTPIAGNDVSNNKFDNMPSGNNFGGDRGRATAFGWGVYGSFTNNVVTRANVGWQDDNHYLASPGAGTLVSGNNIRAYHRGIFHNLQYGVATAATISNNTTAAETNGAFGPSSSNFGIELASIQTGVDVVVTNNNASGHVYGILLWNLPTTANIDINGGTMTNNLYGILATSNDPQFGAGSPSVNTTVTGVTITGSTNAGIAVLNSPPTAATKLAIAGSTLSGNATGIQTSGGAAAADVTTSSIFANTTAGLGIAGGGSHLVNCNSIYNNALGVVAGSDPSAFTLSQNNIVGNGGGAFGLVADPLSVVNAQNNYWGSALGPRPAGTGDGVQGTANFTPFSAIVNGCAPLVNYPTVTIEQVGPDPSNTSPINFTVTFSEPVTGFTASDIKLSGTGNPTTAVVTPASGPAIVYNVAVSGMGQGTVIAEVYSGGGLSASNIPSVASTSTDNTVTYDSVAPTVTINQAVGQPDPDPFGPIDFTVVFSEPVTGFGDSPTDVSFAGSTAGGTLSAAITGGPTTYNVSVTGMTTYGTVVASVPANAAADAATNGNTASTSTDNSVLYMPCINLAVAPPTNTVTTLSGGTVNVPIANTNTFSGYSAISSDITITYTSSVLTSPVVTVNPTGPAAGATLTVGGSPGTLVISLFRASPPSGFSGIGTLVDIQFNVTGLPGSSSAIDITSFVYNESGCTTNTDGVVNVISGTLSGTVTYGNAIGSPAPPRPVPSVMMTSTGTSGNPPPVSTDANGNYSMSGFTGAGPYTITPSKGNHPPGPVGSAISGLDAACVAQYVVVSPSSCMNGAQGPVPGPASIQWIVADVSGNGEITSYDAALIARYAAGFLTTVGSSGTWIFQPVSTTYPNMFTSISNENYTGLIMGEVTGNWNSTAFPRPASGGDGERPVMVSLPKVTAAAGTEFVVPVTISDMTGKGVFAYEFDVVYDAAVITPAEIAADVAGTRSNGMTVTINPVEPGRMRVVVFGVDALSGEGQLINLRFRAVGGAGMTTMLTWENFRFNEGGINVTTTDGRIGIGGSVSPIDGVKRR